MLIQVLETRQVSIQVAIKGQDGLQLSHNAATHFLTLSAVFSQKSRAALT